MPLTKPLRRSRRRQAGSVTLEYLGLAALAVVLLTVSIIAIQGSSWRDGVRSAQCEVLASGCGASVPGGSGGGSGGGNAAGGGAVVQISTQPPPVASGCTTWLGCAAAGVGNGLLNFGKALLDDVVGFFELLRDPSKIIDALRYIWNNPGAAALGLVWDAESAAMWAEGDISGALGRTLYNGGSLVVPGVNLGKLGVLADLGRIGRTAGVVEEVAQLARRAQEAARAGNLDEAADLAAQAQRRADDAADNARRAGCISAGDAPERRVLAMAGPHRTAVTLVLPAAPLVLSSPCGRAASAAVEAQRQADQAAAAARHGSSVTPLGADGSIAPRDRGTDVARRVTDRQTGLGAADQTRIDDLARDPDRGGISNGTRLEALDTLDLERSGGLPGPVRRMDPSNPAEAGADFVDGTGQKWDHKQTYSGQDWNGETFVGNLQRDDLARGENIIINRDALNATDRAELESIIRREGLQDRVIITPAP